jgi:hypothetical protein
MSLNKSAFILLAIYEIYRTFSILKNALTILINSKKFNDRINSPDSNLNENTKNFMRSYTYVYALLFTIPIILIEAGFLYFSPYTFVCVFGYISWKLFLLSKVKED